MKATNEGKENDMWKTTVITDNWVKGEHNEELKKWTLWRFAWSMYWRGLFIHVGLIILVILVVYALGGGSCGVRVG